MHLPQLCVKIEIFVHAYKNAAGSGTAWKPDPFRSGLFIPASNESSGRACTASWLMRCKLDTLLLAAGYLIKVETAADAVQAAVERQLK